MPAAVIAAVGIPLPPVVDTVSTSKEIFLQITPATAHVYMLDLRVSTLQYCEGVPGGINQSKYLSGWFKGADMSSIRRGNLEAFIAYGFCYTTRCVLMPGARCHSPALKAACFLTHRNSVHQQVLGIKVHVMQWL